MLDPAGLNIRYTLRESHALPQICCVKSLKHVLFRGKALHVCNIVLFRLKYLFMLCTLLGVSFDFAEPFLSADYGRMVSPYIYLQMPSVFVTIISMRFDMMVLVFSTYEFWQMTTLNVMFHVLIAETYDDARRISTAPSFFTFQILVLQDANFRALKFVLFVMCLTTIFHTTILVYVGFGLIDQTHRVSIVRYGRHELTGYNVICNYLATTNLLLLRNVYRKHAAVVELGRQDDGAKTMVRCIAYRCRLRLHAVVQHQGPTLEPNVVAPRAQLPARRAQLQLAPSDQDFGLKEAAIPIVLRFWLLHQASPLWRYVLQAVGTTGFLLSWIVLGAPLCCALINQPAPELPRILPLISASASILYCGIFWSLAQRALLRKLVTSFDFALVAMELTLSHLCICDMLHWDTLCLTVLASWLWMLWVITLDACLPAMREQLGFQPWHAMVVDAAFLVFTLLFCIEIVFLDRWALQDRSLFTLTLWGKSVHLRICPFYFNRLLTLLPWGCRILWRLRTSAQGDLVMVQGVVEYDDPLSKAIMKRRHAVRNLRAMLSLKKVVPSAEPQVRMQHLRPKL